MCDDIYEEDDYWKKLPYNPNHICDGMPECDQCRADYEKAPLDEEQQQFAEDAENAEKIIFGNPARRDPLDPEFIVDGRASKGHIPLTSTLDESLSSINPAHVTSYDRETGVAEIEGFDDSEPTTVILEGVEKN